MFKFQENEVDKNEGFTVVNEQFFKWKSKKA